MSNVRWIALITSVIAIFVGGSGVVTAIAEGVSNIVQNTNINTEKDFSLGQLDNVKLLDDWVIVDGNLFVNNTVDGHVTSKTTQLVFYID